MGRPERQENVKPRGAQAKAGLSEFKEMEINTELQSNPFEAVFSY